MEIIVVHDARDILQTVEHTPAYIDEKVAFLQEIDGAGCAGSVAVAASDGREVGRADDVPQTTGGQ